MDHIIGNGVAGPWRPVLIIAACVLAAGGIFLLFAPDGKKANIRGQDPDSGVASLQSRPSQVIEKYLADLEVSTDGGGLRDGERDFSSYFLQGYDSHNRFNKRIVNRHTLGFLKYIQYFFPDGNMNAVREFLHAFMTSAKAEEMLALYSRFVSYETISSEKRSAVVDSFAIPVKNTDHMTPAELAVEKAASKIRAMHEVRRNHFGKGVADELYGYELKAEVYNYRKDFVYNTRLSGAEKERLLSALRSEVYGFESDLVDQKHGISAYYDKLQLYRDDLSQLPATDAARLKDKFLKESVSADVYASMKRHEQAVAARQKNVNILEK